MLLLGTAFAALPHGSISHPMSWRLLAEPLPCFHAAQSLAHVLQRAVLRFSGADILALDDPGLDIKMDYLHYWANNGEFTQCVVAYMESVDVSVAQDSHSLPGSVVK